MTSYRPTTQAFNRIRHSAAVIHRNITQEVRYWHRLWYAFSSGCLETLCPVTTECVSIVADAVDLITFGRSRDTRN